MSGNNPASPATQTEEQQDSVPIWRVWLGGILLVAFVGALLRYLSIHSNEYRNLRVSDPIQLVYVGVAALSGSMARFYLTRQVALSEVPSLPWSGLLKIFFASNLISMVIHPGLGVSWRAYSLKRRFGISFITTGVGLAIFLFFHVGISATICVLFAVPASSVPWLLLSAIGCLLLLGADTRNESRLLRWIAVHVTPAWVANRLSPRARMITTGLLGHALVASVICLLSQVTAIRHAAASIGQRLPFASCLLLASSLQVAGVVALTPGSAGIQEVLALCLATHLGCNGPVTLTILLVIRCQAVFVALLTGIPSLLLIWHDRRELRVSKVAFSCATPSGQSDE